MLCPRQPHRNTVSATAVKNSGCRTTPRVFIWIIQSEYQGRGTSTLESGPDSRVRGRLIVSLFEAHTFITKRNESLSHCTRLPRYNEAII